MRMLLFAGAESAGPQLMTLVLPPRLPTALFIGRRSTPPSDVDGLIVEDMTETNRTGATVDALSATIKPRMATEEAGRTAQTRVVRTARCLVLKMAPPPAPREQPAGCLRRAERPVF